MYVAPEPRPDKPIPNSDYSSISLFSDSESESESDSESESKSDSKSDSESDSESFKLLENLGELRISEKAVGAEIAPPASAASKVVENVLRPVKNVAEDLLQIAIDPDAFIKRFEYVQTEIIPRGLPACVPINFFIMTGRIPENDLDTIINYPKFKCKGMNNLEIGKLLESYGYKHTNQEYKHKFSLDYSERYYEEKQIPGLFIDQIKSTLKPNHVTPVSFHRKNGVGHAACIANLNGEFLLVDANIIGMIPIVDLPTYMEYGGASIKDDKYPKFDKIQIYYGASVEEPNIELRAKRDTSGKIVGIGPTMSKKEEPPIIKKRMRNGGGTRRRALTIKQRLYRRS